MTKVQLEYDLAQPLTEVMMPRVAAAHSLFGMLRVQVAGSALDRLLVDYDASRLTRDQVEAALLGAGLAVSRRG
jgi:hypothetical protein